MDALAPRYETFSQKQNELPAYNRHSQILNAIKQETVVIVSGETGSGKTTQIPQYILNDCAVRR